MQSKSPFLWKIKSKIISLEHPLIAGIVNVTPDSFSDGGNFSDPKKAARHALALVQAGADMVDVGAESTRPGAEPVSCEEELNRLMPVLERLKGKINVPISIDTTKPEVAQKALEAGADIINDVSGLLGSQGRHMAQIVSQYGAGMIVMHRRGNSKTMQSFAHYEDLVKEIILELRESMAIARAAGVTEEQMVVDPGIGFAKTHEQNFELIRRLSEFKVFHRPILVGPSRKSFLSSLTHTQPEQRLHGTIAACVLAFANGAQLFRVHDVAEVKEAMDITEAIIHQDQKGAT